MQLPLQLQCNTHRQLVLSAASFRPTRKMARGKLEKASDGKRGAGRAYVKAGQTGQQLVGRTVWNAIKSHRHAISGVRRPGRIKDSAGTTSTTTRTHHSRPKRKRAVGKALKALKGFSYPLKKTHTHSNKKEQHTKAETGIRLDEAENTLKGASVVGTIYIRKLRLEKQEFL